MVAEVGNVDHTGGYGALVVELIPLQGAKNFQSFPDVSDKFWNGGGVGESGVTRDKSFKALLDLARLDALKERLELFLDGSGRWFIAGVAREKLRNKSGDLGDVGVGAFGGRGRQQGGGKNKDWEQGFFHKGS